MTHPDQPTDVSSYLSAEIVRNRVASMIDGSPLQIEERANELAITNPADPEAGTIHVAYADGYVCWERVTWNYWGHLDGCEPDHDVPDTSVRAEKIIGALNGSPSGPDAA